jgi:CBS domain-containing protein
MATSKTGSRGNSRGQAKKTATRTTSKKLADIMTRNVMTATSDTSLQEAARLMAENNIGMVAIRNGDDIEGVLTDRDIVVRAVAEGRPPRETPVSQAMSTNLVTCREDQTVEEAAQLMQEHRMRRLPIVNDQNELVGVVSLGDLASRADEHLGGETLDKVAASR